MPWIGHLAGCQGPHEETNPVGAITTPQQTPLTTIEIKLTVHVKRQ